MVVTEKLKTTLWEDRFRRFREETAEFMEYAKIIPAQLKEMQDLAGMYWMGAKVLQEAKIEEEKFEAVCRKIHQGLLAGHKAILAPNDIVSKAELVSILEGVKASFENPLIDALLEASKQLDADTYDTHGLMEQKFLEGLEMIDRSQHSVAGPDKNSMSARVFSRAHHSFTFGDTKATELTMNAPRRFVTDKEVLDGLQFAESFVAAAKEGKVKVAVTGVPISTTPEGVEAIRDMEKWKASAQSYLSLRQHVNALNAFLSAQSMRLGFPEVAGK